MTSTWWFLMLAGWGSGVLVSCLTMAMANVFYNKTFKHSWFTEKGFPLYKDMKWIFKISLLSWLGVVLAVGIIKESWKYRQKNSK